jgi:hypothetical protein
VGQILVRATVALIVEVGRVMTVGRVDVMVIGS